MFKKILIGIVFVLLIAIPAMAGDYCLYVLDPSDTCRLSSAFSRTNRDNVVMTSDEIISILRRYSTDDTLVRDSAEWLIHRFCTRHLAYCSKKTRRKLQYDLITLVKSPQLKNEHNLVGVISLMASKSLKVQLESEIIRTTDSTYLRRLQTSLSDVEEALKGLE